MQFVFCVDGLRCSYQVLTELVAQVNVDFVETAFVVAASGKVLIDVLPLAVLLVCFLLDVGKKVALYLITIKEVVPLIDDGLIATAAKGFCLLAHTDVVVLLPL